jgi:hypothetical protein
MLMSAGSRIGTLRPDSDGFSAIYSQPMTTLSDTDDEIVERRPSDIFSIRD